MDIILFGLPILTGIAGFLIQSGLKQGQRYLWVRVAVGATLLALTVYTLFIIAGWGYLSPLFATLIGLVCALVSIGFGLRTLWILKSWRKLSALLLIVVFPLAIFFFVQAGETRSPEEITRQNGDKIVKALYQYREITGQYPENLTELEKGFFQSLPEALTTQHTGWLYQSANDQFVFGYWYYPERMGAGVCLYDSISQTWVCGFNHWGSFSMVMTPVPCKNDDGEWVDTADCK